MIEYNEKLKHPILIKFAECWQALTLEEAVALRDELIKILGDENSPESTSKKQ